MKEKFERVGLDNSEKNKKVVSEFKVYTPRNGSPFYICNYNGKRCKFHITHDGNDIFIHFGFIPKNLALLEVKKINSQSKVSKKVSNTLKIDRHMIDKYYSDISAGACERNLEFEEMITKFGKR